jgi:hypothetical protein
LAINYTKWLKHLKHAVEEVDAAIHEAESDFEHGLVLKTFPRRDGEGQYSTGQLFFERIISELRTTIGILKSIDESAVKGTDLRSQILFDDLLKRQRKLFESLLVAIMLNRDAIWKDNKAQDYLLHLHLVHDYEHYRHLNADLSDSFGKTNEFIEQCMKDIEKRIGQLPIDQSNCEWAVAKGQSEDRKLPDRVLKYSVAGAVVGSILGVMLSRSGMASVARIAITTAAGTAVGLKLSSTDASLKPGVASVRLKPQSANAMFLNVRKDASSLEKAALGLSYRALFGLSSGQIHFTLSRFHTATANEWDLLQAVENSALLCICLALRLIDFIERMNGKVGTESESLRKHFRSVLPNTLANAVFGEADKGDLVVVFRKEGSGNFFGLVTQKKFRGTDRYCAYEVEHATGGRLHWFGATDVMLVVRKARQADFIANAITTGYATEEARGNLPLAIDQILKKEDGGKLFTGPMGDHLPRLYFVEEYLKEHVAHS